MSTEFFLDKNLKKPVFVRFAGGCEKADKDLRYVFIDVKNLVDFLISDQTTIIYSEYGVPYTAVSLLHEIMNRGVIIINKL